MVFRKTLVAGLLGCALILAGGGATFAAITQEELKQQADAFAAQITAVQGSYVGTAAEKAKLAQLANVVSQLQENIVAASQGNPGEIAFLTDELASLQGQFVKLTDRSAQCRVATNYLQAAVSQATAAVTSATSGTFPQVNTLNLIPAPVSTAAGSGSFVLKSGVVLVADDVNGQQITKSMDYLANTIQSSTGIDVRGAPSSTSPCILLTLKKDLPSQLGSEGYVLTVSSQSVLISARSEAGLFQGAQTLLQLLPTAIYKQTATTTTWRAPAVQITDWPRYKYRGAMLDMGRRFYPVEDVKRFIDQVANLKINVLHMHLTEDQGWRITIPAIPALTDIGGTIQSGWASKPENKWYYTKEQFADIVAYANQRFIDIIPEINGPGHTAAALASIANLNCNNVARPPYIGFDVRVSALCLDDAHLPNVKSYLETVIAEVATQSPGKFIHTGGDEVPSGFSLDRYNKYVGLVAAEIAKANKTQMGWHEIASGPIAAGTLLQYWGTEGERAKIGTANEGTEIGLVRQGLAKGGKFVISPADRAYIDMKYTSSTPYGLSWAGLITVNKSYTWDPLQILSNPAGSIALLADGDIEGVEAPLWADRAYTGSSSLPNANTVWPSPRDYTDYMAFPRLASTAEIAWSPRQVKSWDGFKTRLGYQGMRWDAYGTKFFRSPEIVWQTAPVAFTAAQ